MEALVPTELCARVPGRLYRRFAVRRKRWRHEGAAPTGDSVRVVMTMEPLHDEAWTQRLVMGRENELDNLAKLIDRKHAGTKRH